ncbi:facilitated trehalose transporter Tret1-like [Periplaneta americana]|uniref:facilitated trehalose transporter Tret1-like n=1 Tax=Periplaneta americana TaxID=6978 RepID=UPI0037E723C1
MAEEEKSKTVPRRLLIPQLIVACVCALGGINCGLSTGHSAVLIPRLHQNDSTIPIDDDIGSWIASIYSMGMPLGNIIGGSLTDRLGRRMTLRLSQLSYILGWILLATAQSHQMVIAARFILGIARGMIVDTVFILMDEHSDARLRGILSLHMSLTYVIGILIITGLGTVLEWRISTVVATFFSIAGFLATWVVPESPIWLVRNGKTHMASCVLEKAWGKNQKIQARQELETMITRCQKDGNVLFKMFLRPQVIKSFVISFILIMLQVFCGTHMFVFYSVDIISRARHGSQDLLDEYAVTNIAGFLRIAVLIVMAWVSIGVKRRTIILSTAIVSSICLLSLGSAIAMNATSKLMSERAQSWLLLSLIFVYIALSSIGIFTIPTILIGELLPSKIRGLACGVIYAINEVVLGSILKSYPLMWKTMGIHGMFWLFGSFCLLFALFVFLFVPETHNHTLIQIEEYFQGHNILWQMRPKVFRNRESLQQQLISPQNTPDKLERNNTVYLKLRERELSETGC